MKIEHKKKLAVWMGWKLADYTRKLSYGGIESGTRWVNHIGVFVEMEKWNPDTDPVQFALVWARLTIDEAEKVIIEFAVHEGLLLHKKEAGRITLMITVGVTAAFQKTSALMKAVLTVLELDT